MALFAVVLGLALLVVAAPLKAQTAADPLSATGSAASTVDGRAPQTAGSTTSVGKTKPPGTAAPGTTPELEKESRNLDRKINTGICKGC